MKKHIEELFLETARKTNHATSRVQALAQNKEYYLALDYNQIYGGYTIVAIDNITGEQHHPLKPFSTQREKAKTMLLKMRCFLDGLDFKN